MGRVRKRLTYANVVASLALFIALGGSSYAAVQLSKNSVRSKHIRNGQVKSADIARSAVTTAKVRDRSLLSTDFKAGQLPAGARGPAGAVGPQGLQGAPGPQGATGAPGPASGPAGGDLAGSYPNPELRAGSVGVAERSATPQVKVRREQVGTGVAVPTGTNFTLGFNTERFDVGDMWSPAAPDRIVVTTPGTYLIEGSAIWNSAQLGGNERTVCVLVRSGPTTFKDTECRTDEPHTEWTQSQRVTFVMQLEAGDFVQLSVNHDRGSNANVLKPQLAAVWLAPSA